MMTMKEALRLAGISPSVSIPDGGSGNRCNTRRLRDRAVDRPLQRNADGNNPNYHDNILDGGAFPTNRKMR